MTTRVMDEKAVTNAIQEKLTKTTNTKAASAEEMLKIARTQVDAFDHNEWEQMPDTLPSN